MKLRLISNSKFILIIIGLILTFGIFSCKKLIEVDAPINNINAANVYSKDATAIAAVTGIYTQMSASFFEVSSHSLFQGLSADEFTLWSGINNNLYNYFYSNSLTNSNAG